MKAFEYIRQSFFFFRQHLATIAAIQLPFVIVLNLVAYWVTGQMTEGDKIDMAPLAILNLASLTVLPIYWGATILYLQSVVDNEPVRPLQAIVWALKYWRHLLITYLLTGLAVFAGLLMLIVPGIFIGTRLSFAEYICVLEEKKAVASLKQSWEQSEAYFSLLLQGLLILFGGLMAVELITLDLIGSEEPQPYEVVISVIFDLLGALATIYGFRIYCVMKADYKSGNININH